MPTPTKPRFKLRLRSLDFISAVDSPAQETATVALLKRAGGGFEVEALTAHVAKLDEELGLVFGYALTSQKDGAPYFDLQGDAITDGDELIKVAMEYAQAGGVADEQHDFRDQGGRVLFLWPMTPEVAKALEIDTGGTYGLLIGMKPTPEAFARFKSGEYTGFSIAGLGEREPVENGKRAPSGARKAGVMTTATAGHQHLIADADWPSGETGWARSLGADSGHSHPWVKQPDGSIEIGETEGHTHQVGAKVAAAGATAKRQRLTATAEGHAHVIDDGEDGGRTDEVTGTDQVKHSHPWVWVTDPATGGRKVVIGDSEGHTHAGVVDPEADLAGAKRAGAARARDEEAFRSGISKLTRETEQARDYLNAHGYDLPHRVRAAKMFGWPALVELVERLGLGTADRDLQAAEAEKAVEDVSLEKAQADAEAEVAKLQAEYDAYVAAKAAKGVRLSQLAERQDPGWVERYDALRLAKDRVQTGPAEAVIKRLGLHGEIEKAQRALEDRTTEFCFAAATRGHPVPRHKALATLLKIKDPVAVDAYDRIDGARRRVELVQAESQQWAIEQQRKRAEQAEDEAERAAGAAELADAPPAIKAWNQEVARVMAAEGVSKARASRKVMDEDPELYEAVSVERQRLTFRH